MNGELVGPLVAVVCAWASGYMTARVVDVFRRMRNRDSE